MASAPALLVFDSGLGGLTVHREIVRLRPDARIAYAADDEGFPYGGWNPQELSRRIVGVVGALIEQHHPGLVVIACNTASTIALADLRKAYSLPFVGTVPAIKPACASSRSKQVSVLGTEATVALEYTRGLIRDFAQGCTVTLVGSKRLAPFAEGELRGMPASDDDIRAEIAPCFVEQDGARTDTVVLACTHYPLLLERLQRLSPWPVSFVDPAPAIARRVAELIGPPGAASAAPGVFQCTSGKPFPQIAGALQPPDQVPPGTMVGKISSAPR